MHLPKTYAVWFLPIAYFAKSCLLGSNIDFDPTAANIVIICIASTFNGRFNFDQRKQLPMLIGDWWSAFSVYVCLFLSRIGTKIIKYAIYNTQDERWNVVIRFRAVANIEIDLIYGSYSFKREVIKAQHDFDLNYCHCFKFSIVFCELFTPISNLYFWRKRSRDLYSRRN